MYTAKDQVSMLQEPSRETHGKRHTRRKSLILQSFLKKIIKTVLSTGVFFQFLSISWRYMHNFSCGETQTQYWFPQPVFLYYFAIKVLFKAFY